MKQWVILIIVIAVLGLGLSYRQNAVERAAANLIADAYRGDLTAVKNDVEDGAPWIIPCCLTMTNANIKGPILPPCTRRRI
ncbi:MAG: hypothetical protein PUK24_06135 [Elusimicrobia bacterium]|nr:hypothetical protein [Elusimicrobiota bacterium]